ncbi:hypothetical protein EON73_00270 [bacterium]|nr:MAG: hypothetical protein EON73_00270 [bacterium]
MSKANTCIRLLLTIIVSLSTVHLWAQSKSALDAPEVYAVVVGLGDYADPGLDKLKFPGQDAEAMYQFIKSPSCGSVPSDHIVKLIGKDATRQNILRATSKLFKLSTRNDMIIFYFSGHGKGGEFSNSGFLLPFDAELDDLTSSAVPMEQIAAIISSSEAKMKCVYIDACHAGLYPTGTGFKGSKSDLNEETASAFTTLFSRSSGGSMAVLSSKGKEESKESEQLKHGIFTHFLLQGLKGSADITTKDGIVSAGELESYLTSQVSRYSGNKQHPLVLGDQDSDFPLSVIGVNKGLIQLIKNTPFPVSSTKPQATLGFATVNTEPSEKTMNEKICYDKDYAFGLYNFVNATGKPLVLYYMATLKQGINIGFGTPTNLLIPPGGKGKTPRIKVSYMSSSTNRPREEATDYVFYFNNGDDSNLRYCTLNYLVEACKETTIVLTENEMKFSSTKPR